MNIESINYRLLRNNEHQQFHTECKNLIEKYGASALGIGELYQNYPICINNESEALKKITKSAYTEDLIVADDHRDSIYRGMTDMLQGSANHFRTEIRQATARLQVVFGHYGNLAIKSYDEETTTINNLISELSSASAGDISTIDLTEWVAELQAANQAFVSLFQSRYDENTAKTRLVMRQVREETDNLFRSMVTRINALIIVNGEKDYVAFAKDVNERIDHFRQILLQRKGRNDQPEPPVA
jgi:hypothetical protein